VADADVIPIGSGGRPGRGTGRRTTPSAAARALAGQAGRPKKGRATKSADDSPTISQPANNVSIETSAK